MLFCDPALQQSFPRQSHPDRKKIRSPSSGAAVAAAFLGNESSDIGHRTLGFVGTDLSKRVLLAPDPWANNSAGSLALSLSRAGLDGLGLDRLRPPGTAMRQQQVIAKAGGSASTPVEPGFVPETVRSQSRVTQVIGDCPLPCRRGRAKPIT